MVPVVAFCRTARSILEITYFENARPLRRKLSQQKIS